MEVERKPIRGPVAGFLILLCMIWGSQHVALKAAAPDIAPAMQVALRSVISTTLVGIVIACGKERFTWRDATLRPGLIVGVLFALQFIFLSEGLRFSTASHISVFHYTGPVFTALSLHWFMPSERLKPHQWAGVAIAFGGIVLAFAGGILGTGFNLRILFGDFLGLLGGITWGACTVIIRCSSLANAPAKKTLLYQLVAAVFILFGYAALTGQATKISLTTIAWASLLYQGVIITFASYLAWFWLLTKYLASRLSIFSFLSPVFGVCFGALLLHEPLHPYFIIGALMVLSGITLVSRSHFMRRT